MLDKSIKGAYNNIVEFPIYVTIFCLKTQKMQSLPLTAFYTPHELHLVQVKSKCLPRTCFSHVCFYSAFIHNTGHGWD